MTTAAPFGISIDTTSPTFAPLRDPQAILKQWVDLQFQTRLGFYWSAPEIGCDLQTYVLRGLTPDKLAAIPGEIQAALDQDERIAGVSVTATRTYTALGAAQLNLHVTVNPKNPNVGSFSFSAIASAAIANQMTQGLGV
jgi:hypothetical protein